MNAQQELLSLRGVQAMTDLDSAGIFRLVRLGDFPAPVRTDRCAPTWNASEVSDWVQRRITAERGGKIA